MLTGGVSRHTLYHTHFRIIACFVNDGRSLVECQQKSLAIVSAMVQYPVSRLCKAWRNFRVEEQIVQSTLVSIGPGQLAVYLSRRFGGCARGCLSTIFTASGLSRLCLPLLVGLSVSVNLWAEDGIRYSIVQPGDSFASVSEREFGSSALGRLIAERNEIDYDTTLSTGQRLIIPVAPDPKYESAEVVFAKGDPILLVRGQDRHERLLQPGHRVFASDVIQTDDTGFVSLLFPAGTVVNIQPGSKVGLINLDCLSDKVECVIEMNASEGNVVNRVNRRDGQPATFKVTTPHASAAVRGTVFDIGASVESLLIGVTDGEVAIDAQGASTELEKGLGARTRAGLATEKPVPLLPSPSFQRAAVRVSEEDVLSWYRVDRAEQYWVAIGNDEQGNSTLLQGTQTGLSYQIPTLAAGEYYLTVRPLDRLGLRGFPDSLKINTVELDRQAAPVTLELFSDSAGRFVTAPSFEDPDNQYEIQMAFNETFRDVTSVDVGVDSGMVFEPVGMPAYVRARLILDDKTVGPFGPTLELPAE